MSDTVELATAYLSLVPSLEGAQGKIAEELGVAGDPAGRKIGGGLVSGLTSALGPVAGLMAGVFSAKAAIDWGSAQIDSLKRIESINAQTASAIQSTGGSAGVTAEHVEQLAGRLEDLTATEAESTQQGANLLLTFKNIRNEAGAGNDIFDQATTSLVDMARAMGTEPQAAAIQLGKALNDPIAGIAALSRVGIQFTDDQKSLIGSLVESGQTMEAQKIILGELNSQFGGSGQNYAATTAGQVELLGHAWGTFGEQVFSTAMPAIGAIAGGLTDFLNGTLTPFVANVQDGFKVVVGAFTGAGADVDVTSWTGPLINLGAAFRSIWDALEPLVGKLFEVWSAFSPLSLVLQVIEPLLPQLTAVFTQLATTLSGVLRTALTAILQAVAPVVEILTGQLSSILATLIPIVAQLAQTLMGSLASTLTQLVPVIGRVVSVLGDVLGSVLQAMTPLLTMLADIVGQVLAAVLPLIDPILQLVMAFLPLLEPIIQLVGALLTPLIQLLTALLTPILSLISPLVDLLAGALGVVVGVLTQVVSWIVEAIRWVVALVTGSEEAGAQFNAVWTAVGQWFADVWNNIVQAVSIAINSIGDFIGGIRDTITGIFSGIGTWLVDSGKALIQGFIDGILGMVDFVGDAVGGVMDFVGGFFPHSPAKRGPFSGAGWNQVSDGGVALMEHFAAGIAATPMSDAITGALDVPDMGSLAPLAGTGSSLGAMPASQMAPTPTGAQERVQIDVHPSADMDEELIAEVTARELEWVAQGRS